MDDRSISLAFWSDWSSLILMKRIGLYEAKTRLSALVAELEAGGEGVFLTRHGKVVAELRPHVALVSPKRGCLKSAAFAISDDFDAPELGFEDFFGEAAGGRSATRVAEAEPPE